jgi:Fic family protein
MARPKRKAKPPTVVSSPNSPKSRNKLLFLACIIVFVAIAVGWFSQPSSDSNKLPDKNERYFTGKFKDVYLEQKGSKIKVKQFLPNVLPPRVNLKDRRMLYSLQDKLSTVHEKFNEVAALSLHLSNSNYLLLALLKKEAVISNQIEGNTKTIEEFFQLESGYLQAQTQFDKDEFAEISAYMHSLTYAMNETQATGKISVDLILKMQSMVVNSTRGHDKEPGHFRTRQVAVGPQKASLDQIYVPPPHDLVPALIQNLVEYYNNDVELPLVIKLGVVHGQFETIHPFRDGNGRVGRFLITLGLLREGVLSAPVINPSIPFKNLQSQYYGNLNSIRRESSWEPWLHFYMDSLEQAADYSSALLKDLMNLEKTYRQTLSNATLPIATEFLEFLFKFPYVNEKTAEKFLGPNFGTILEEFVQKGILQMKAPGWYELTKFVHLLNMTRDPLDGFPIELH